MSHNPDSLSRAAFLVLLALAEEPGHGLRIIERIDGMTGGEIRMGPATLYTTLQKLLLGGLIRETTTAPDPADHDRRRRYYAISPQGKRMLRHEAARMRVLVRAAASRKV